MIPRDAKYHKAEETKRKREATKEANRPPNVAEIRQAAEEAGYSAYKGYRLFKAFHDGTVDAVKKTPIMNMAYSTDPASQAAYLQGFAWANQWKGARAA